jgi:peroxiredoxin
MKRRAFLFNAFAVSLSAGELESSEGRELIGRPAPPLNLKHWINSAPLEMADLRGKVVLLRWWTQGCPLCVATGPALIGLQRKYGERGLQVIGIYHPKPPGDWDLAKVRAATDEKEFTFPVALDADWSALKRWWLDRKRDYTSVSFLVDRKGVVQYVHPGGEFHQGTHESCQRDYVAIENKILHLLAN